MSASVEFFFDFGSPASYLAYCRLPRLAAVHEARIAWRPMLLGGVFKATGNASPVSVPAKGQWMRADLERWARIYGVGFAWNPHFPINTLTLMRGAVGMQMRAPERFEQYLSTMFRAMWREPRNLGDAEVLAETLTDAGFDAQAFVELVADPEVKAALIANTDEAIERGVFGAPTFFVGEYMFFGQDRLGMVADALG